MEQLQDENILKTIIEQQPSDVNTDVEDHEVDPDKMLNEEQLVQIDNAILHDPSAGSSMDFRLIVLGAMNFLINGATSLIVPLFPNQIIAQGLTQVYSSIIFAVLPIGSVVAALYVGKNMLQHGRQKLMILGLIMSVLTLGSYAFVTFIPSEYNWLFVTVCILMRVFQGAGRAAYSTVVFAYVPILWPERIQQNIGILESLTGLGVIVGPIIGGLLSVLGSSISKDPTLNLAYRLPFLILSFLFAIWIIPIAQYMPPDIIVNDLDQSPNTQKKNAKVPLGLLMKNPGIAMTCFASMMSCAGGSFFNPILQPYLIQVYNLAEEYIPFIFGALAFGYVMVLLILPRFEKSLIYKFTISTGLLMNFIGVFLLPPVLGEPEEYWTVIKGLFIVGISQGLAILPLIPELKMIIMSNQYTTDDIEASDLAAGVFFASFSAGIFVGPGLQGIVTAILGSIYHGNKKSPDWFMYNFRWTCNAIGVIILLSFIIYGIIGEAFKQGWSLQLKIFSGKAKDAHSVSPQLKQHNKIVNKREKVRGSIKLQRSNSISQRAESVLALSRSNSGVSPFQEKSGLLERSGTQDNGKTPLLVKRVNSDTLN